MGKAVDDILILDNKMLLIDNIVYPKFTFEYDVSTPNKPFWVETIELPEGRPYENIINKINSTMLLLVSKYTYERIDLDNLRYLDESIEERFWSYGSLDLSDRDLASFPIEKIKHLERVEHLDLSNNSNIKEFPKALRKCTRLRSLNLKFTGITKIPDWIEEFENLEYLNISTINIDNPIPFMASRIKFPKSLKILNLRYCQISAIPPSVFGLKDLEYLNLLENDISKIPDEITALQKLIRLKIRWENISKFPDDINNLTLETVGISAHRGKMPEVIYAMTNLKRIEAEGAGIKSISPKIANFSKLEYLDLRNNYDLKKLPKNIGELKNLKRLGLSICGLKELPESFCDLTELEVLHLQHNKLTKLPDSIGKLSKLRKLDLEANQLTELPESFKHLASLKSLLLSRNKLKILPDGIKKLQNIKEAELWDNRLEDFPKALCDLKKLTILNMWDNKIEAIPLEIQNLVNLTQLNMVNNGLVTLPKEIGALSKLDELSLYKNNLKALPSSIGKLKALTDLSLSDNALTELPQELFTLATLEKLNVENNELEELPEQISQLGNLKKLEISGNKFTVLPESIVNLKKMEDMHFPDYVFTLSQEQTDWLREPGENGNSIGGRLPLPPSSYMSNTERIYSESKGGTIPVVDEKVLDVLIQWADDNHLDELKWREPWSDGDEGSWDGFPRDKELLVRLRDLNLLGAKYTVLPKEIGYLTHLVKLNLGENDLDVLPEEIVNLVPLNFINLNRNQNLKLTEKQKQWLSTLKENGATVWVDDDILD